MSTALVHHQALPVPIEIRPMRNARRLRLRYDERRGILKLTCPKGFSRRQVLTWAGEQQDWIHAQIARSAVREEIVDGGTIPFKGLDVTLRWSADAQRTPRIEGGSIICGGPAESFGARIERFLRAHALQTLSEDTQEYAAKAGVTCRSVSVGDAATRWGSCSSAGRIRYNWRLIMAPPEARRYVVAHEVAHLVHLNHGPQFHLLEQQLFGDVAAARALLREVGGRLRGVVTRL